MLRRVSSLISSSWDSLRGVSAVSENSLAAFGNFNPRPRSRSVQEKLLVSDEDAEDEDEDICRIDAFQTPRKLPRSGCISDESDVEPGHFGSLQTDSSICNRDTSDYVSPQLEDLDYDDEYEGCWREFCVDPERKGDILWLVEAFPVSLLRQSQIRGWNELYAAMKEAERSSPVSMKLRMTDDPLLRLSWALRAEWINWLLEVGYLFHFQRQTIYLAQSLFDGYCALADIQFSGEDVQKTGLTCLFIAAKLEEVHAFDLSDFLSGANATFERRLILDEEIAICMSLDFRLKFPTVADWIGFYCELMKELLEAFAETEDAKALEGDWRHLEGYCEALRLDSLEVCDMLMLSPGWLHFAPSSIAAAVLHLSAKDRAENVLRFTGYRYEELARQLRWIAPYTTSSVRSPFRERKPKTKQEEPARARADLLNFRRLNETVLNFALGLINAESAAGMYDEMGCKKQNKRSIK